MTGILVADDLPVIRSGIIRILRQSALSLAPILEAADGDQAVQMARQYKPDIILMDIKMPDMTGLQASALIRAEQQNVKIVMLTAYNEFSYIQKALQQGARDYLLKPVRPAKLIELLEQIQKEIFDEQRNQRTIAIVKDSLQKTLPVIEANLVENLIRGVNHDPVITLESLSYLGKSLNHPAVIVAKIDNFVAFAERKSSNELLQIYLSSVEIINQLLPEPLRALVGYSKPGRLIVILSCDETLSSKERILELAEQIRQSIATEMSYTVTIGIGNIYSEIESTIFSYAEANLARRFQSHIGGNTVVHIQDVLKLSLNQNDDYTYRIQREQDLIHNIQNNDPEQILKLGNEIVDYLTQRYINTPEGFNHSCAELVTLTAWAVISSNFDQRNVLKILHTQVMNLNSQMSIQEVRTWTMNCLAEYLTILQSRTQKKNAVAQAVEYLQNNYHRSDISLKEVAEAVYLSQSYLGQLFKTSLGVSYIKLVTTLRIEEAKRLLRTTDLNIGFIAEKVGYPNVTNFYRHFHRQEGKTPTEYRQMET